MDKSTLLRECRHLLREIHCEAVTDTSDQNLYDILIRSEEKKTVLLSWLVQNVFSPAQCARSSFEDLMSMFMTKAELTSFLKGTMSVKNQYGKWILLMTTVEQMRRQAGINSHHTLDRILNGKLLDECIDSWNQKVTKPSASLHPNVPNTVRVADLQNKLSAAREQLKQLESLSESNSEVFVESTDLEEGFGEIVPKFLNEYRSLKRRGNQQISSENSRSSDHFIEDLRRHPILVNIQPNLLQLHDIMNASTPKNTTG